MKSISPIVYESLTPHQRIIAAIEAEARDDREELRRLVKSCPKKSYLMTDPAFSEEMQMLIGRSLAFECDMAEMAIQYLFLSWRRKDNPEAWLSGMAILQAAWDEELKDMGIDPVAMAKAGKPRSRIVDFLLDQAAPPDPADVKALREKLANIEAERKHW